MLRVREHSRVNKRFVEFLAAPSAEIVETTRESTAPSDLTSSL